MIYEVGILLELFEMGMPGYSPIISVRFCYGSM
jgi:hypothetical protein